MYPNGIPDPDKLGFIPLNAIGHGGDFSEAIQIVAATLEQSAQWVDEDGVEHEITAASVDAERQRYAWVKCKSKDDSSDNRYYVSVSFTLNVVVQDRLVVSWLIKTYNPYFGCQVEAMHWTPDHLIFVYHEKHHTYICSFLVTPDAPGPTNKAPLARHQRTDENNEYFFLSLIPTPDELRSQAKPYLARHKLTDEWLIRDNTIIYRSETVDQVERRAFPDLQLLEPWSAEEARAQNALPPGYDKMNEINRKYS